MKPYSIIENKKPITGELESLTFVSTKMSFSEIEKDLIAEKYFASVPKSSFPLFDGHVFELPKYTDEYSRTLAYCPKGPRGMDDELKNKGIITMNCLTVNNN